jgi:hypothetical protein
VNSQERVVAGVTLRVEAGGLVLAFGGSASNGNDGLNKKDKFHFIFFLLVYCSEWDKHMRPILALNKNVNIFTCKKWGWIGF